MRRTHSTLFCLMVSIMLILCGCITVYAASSNFTFADLGSTKFEFSSGAGAWSTNMTIFKDGHFRGQYHDSEMGDTGEGYKNGTEYICNFSGNFSEPVKIDDYTYKVTMKDLKYQNEPGYSVIVEDIRYVYSTAYGLTGNTFYIYLPGTPLSKLNSEVKSWITMGNQNDQTLTMYVFADMDNKTAFMSYNTDVKQDALNLYEDSKRSYESTSDYLARVDMTQYEMNCTAKYMYDEGDYCLNYMWDVIKYNADDATYQKLLAEQRTWVKEKEQKARAAAAQYEGGSMYDLEYYSVLADLTYTRCGELAAYIKKMMNSSTAGAAAGKSGSGNYADYAGTYTSSYDGSTFTLNTDGSVKIDITRLTSMDGSATGINDGIISIKTKDANDNDMALTFNTKTRVLTVTDSKWNYLPNGQTFQFETKK